MDNLNLTDLNLSSEESKDIIEILARKRNIKNYKLKSSNELLHAVKKIKITNNSLKIRKE